MPKAASIKPGDRFVRVGTYKSIWVVRRLLDLEDMPPHLHIQQEGGYRVLTFSVSALLDKTLFTPLPPLSEEEMAERLPKRRRMPDPAVDAVVPGPRTSIREVESAVVPHLHLGNHNRPQDRLHDRPHSRPRGPMALASRAH
ncbi:MAG: hypothetical protein ACPGOV_03265 [Magnetovibrionaceae bacterium]